MDDGLDCIAFGYVATSLDINGDTVYASFAWVQYNIYSLRNTTLWVPRAEYRFSTPHGKSSSRTSRGDRQPQKHISNLAS